MYDREDLAFTSKLCSLNCFSSNQAAIWHEGVFMIRKVYLGS